MPIHSKASNGLTINLTLNLLYSKPNFSIISSFVAVKLGEENINSVNEATTHRLILSHLP